jgi:PAS domain S-box-containing protein
MTTTSVIALLIMLASIIMAIILMRREREFRIAPVVLLLALAFSLETWHLLAHTGRLTSSTLDNTYTDVARIALAILSVVSVWVIAGVIAGQKTAARELARSEEKFQKAFKSSPDAIVITRLDDATILDVNEGFERITGVTREQAMGHTSLELDVWANPADRDRLFEAVQKTGRVRELEIEFQSIQGERRLCEVAAEQFNLGGESHLVTIVRDITQRRKLEREIDLATEQERRRIGTDLHDSLAQELVGISMLLKVCQRGGGKDEQYVEIEKALRGAIGTVRRIAQGLAPLGLESGGLAGALRSVSRSIGNMYHVAIHVNCPADISTGSAAIDSHLYWIAQEAMFNAARHSQCSNIWVETQSNGYQLELNIRDDGRGVARANAPSREGMGMKTMQHRAQITGSKLSVEDLAKGGTQVRCVTPLRETQTASPEQRPEPIPPVARASAGDDA